jgi:intein/homing endonuclease
MIPIIDSPVEFENNTLPIDPYIFGQLLGDGSFRIKPIRITSCDAETIDYFSNKFGDNLKYLKDYSYRILGLNEIIESMGLYGKYSHEKFIPNIYKYSSIENRISLIQGLMDSDGTVNKIGSACFTSTSEQLVNDLTEIVNSLGGITYKTSQIGKLYGVEHKRTFKLSINLPPSIIPFKLTRKRELYKPNVKYTPKRYIYNIIECGEEECQCIKVDDPSMLYLTRDYIVTHNTYIAVYSALEALKNRKVDYILYIRSAVESASKSMGFLPGELSSKFENYSIPLIQKLNET